MEKPNVIKAKTVKRIPLSTNKHTAILLERITSGGKVQYKYILAVFDDASNAPCLFVTSEVNAMWMLGGGKHFLCVFDEHGHANMGSDDDWGNRDKFEKAAMDLVMGALQQG